LRLLAALTGGEDGGVEESSESSVQFTLVRMSSWKMSPSWTQYVQRGNLATRGARSVCAVPSLSPTDYDVPKEGWRDVNLPHLSGILVCFVKEVLVSWEVL